MAEENGLNGNINTHHANKGDQQEEKSKVGKEKVNTVTFYKLFIFADSKDIFLMIIGSFGAVANGLTMPITTLFLGNIIDAFGENAGSKNVVDKVSKVGNSSRHSFSVSFGLPTALNIQENASAVLKSSTLPASEKAPDVPLHRLTSLNKPEIHMLLLGIIFATINGVLYPLFGILFSGMIESFYKPPSELRKDAGFWALIFIAFAEATLVVSPARTYFFEVAGNRLIQRIRSMCFEKVLHMEVSWFDEPEHSSSGIGARLSTDAAAVCRLVGDALALLVQNLATTISSLVIAFAASWQLALIILFLLPLVGVNEWVQMKFMKGFNGDAKVVLKKY